MKHTLSLSLMFLLVLGVWYSVGYMHGFHAGENYNTGGTILGDGGSDGTDE